ncbi:MAG: hypothetical protein GY755_10805 [Chloroflexi bacterium]|nr:hypothetical protein [Chloroflexota bacterium]
MLILITLSFLFLGALALLLLRIFNPDFRYPWLIAVSSIFLAWASVLFWQIKIPLELTLPAWQPVILFPDSPHFIVDQLSWVYAFSLTTVGLGTILTAIVRKNFPSAPAWVGILALNGIGILAVLAENPLALVLTWTAIDLAELFTLLASVKEENLRERAVISFSMRVLGSGFLIWAGLVSTAAGTPLNFISASKESGIYMLIAAGLRLGVFPMHLPFKTESALRRGYGTMLRLTSAASSLILLARIPYESLQSPFIPYVFAIISLTALYSSWMWFRASDTLDARPYWLLGMASLALISSLRANPVGSVAWGTALILGGGLLFLSSLQNKWLNRLLQLSLIAMSTLPFTLTATAWQSQETLWWGYWFILLSAQALLLAGYYRHAQRVKKTDFKSHSPLSRFVYPLGIGIIFFALLILGIWGWPGAIKIGAWYLGLIATFITLILIWLRPRIRSLDPLEAHWLKPNTAEKTTTGRVYSLFWSLYYFLRRLSRFITNILESDGGILWTLLFIILFASLIAEGIR